MAVEIQVVYEGGLHCQATHKPSGSVLTTDAPLDNGGKGESFSPTDLVATALGSCVMTIIALVAERRKLDVTGMRIRVEKEMAATPVRRIASLKTLVTIPAASISEQADRERIEAAALKCPVHQSIHPDIDAPIHFEYAP